MITYVNSSNTALYSALFSEVSELLHEKGLLENDYTITTIEEYFSFMGVLPHLTDEAGRPVGKRYTILPLDEEVFEINANTRVITVPPSFKTNGISVQGDQVAEIVYFRIDRFFDATDLNEMDIYIQWETPKGNKGVSKEWVRDIESDPGKIIFGWPLSLDITETPGPIKFSVRFFKINTDEATKEQKIIYSFSTLTQTANIKPALDFSLLDELYVVDDTDLIANRFTNSVVVGGVKPDAPQFLVNLDSDAEYDLDESGKYEFMVHAFSPNAGIISYEWKKEGEEGYLPSEEVFIKTEDTSPTTGKIYYEKTVEIDEAGREVYKPYGGVIDEETFELVDLYERVSICLVDSVGKYYAIATNRVGLNTANANSEYGIIPAPKAPTVSEILNSNNEEMSRYILPEPVPGEEYTASIAMKVSATAPDAGSLTYQWYNVTNIARNTEVAIEGATGDTYIAKEPGRYIVAVTNTRNNETISARPEMPCRVSYPATIPEIAVSGGEGRLGITLNVLPDSTSIYADRADYFEYQWMENADDFNSVEDDIIIEGANAPTYTPVKSGVYYAKVRSIYNGDYSEWVSSAKFSVFNN